MAGFTMTFGSGVMDSVFGKSQEPIRMFLERRGEQFEQASVVKQLFYMGTTDKFGDKITTMTAMEGFRIANILAHALVDAPCHWLWCVCQPDLLPRASIAWFCDY